MTTSYIDPRSFESTSGDYQFVPPPPPPPPPNPQEINVFKAEMEGGDVGTK